MFSLFWPEDKGELNWIIIYYNFLSPIKRTQTETNTVIDKRVYIIYNGKGSADDRDKFSADSQCYK